MPKIDGSAPSRRRLVTGAAAAALAVTGMGGGALAQGLKQAIQPIVTRPQPHADVFEKFVNQPFVVWKGDFRTLLTLTSVQIFDRGKRAGALPTPFSLYFRGGPNTRFDSGLYEVAYPDGTHTTMFLTPVGKGVIYEAPFN
jgi:hypothetical protein